MSSLTCFEVQCHASFGEITSTHRMESRLQSKSHVAQGIVSTLSTFVHKYCSVCSFTVPSPRMVTVCAPVVTFRTRTIGTGVGGFVRFSCGLLAVNAIKPTAPRPIKLKVTRKCKIRLFVLLIEPISHLRLKSKEYAVVSALNRLRLRPAAT